MMSPSDEERIVAMVDSFTKTVARNFSRNLKRAKANAEKHYAKIGIPAPSARSLSTTFTH